MSAVFGNGGVEYLNLIGLCYLKFLTLKTIDRPIKLISYSIPFDIHDSFIATVKKNKQIVNSMT